jgi:MoxR-like ATPase
MGRHRITVEYRPGSGERRELTRRLRDGGYLADRGLATTLLVSLSLRRPVLLEGEVGVGKTEVAKVLADVFGRKLIRLQCYEGISTSQALPVVILTSNRTREPHDALRRRCLYHWIGYPTADREAQIIAVREPGAAPQLTAKVVAAVQRLRELDMAKPPGVAETIDWVRTLGVLGETELTPDSAPASPRGAALPGRSARQRPSRPRSTCGPPGYGTPGSVATLQDLRVGQHLIADHPVQSVFCHQVRPVAEEALQVLLQVEVRHA